MLKLIPKDGPVFRRQNTKEILEDELKQDYETVIVFGFKNGSIFTRHSENINCLEIIGALTVAREEFWERHSNGA